MCLVALRVRTLVLLFSGNCPLFQFERYMYWIGSDIYLQEINSYIFYRLGMKFYTNRCPFNFNVDQIQNFD